MKAVKFIFLFFLSITILNINFSFAVFEKQAAPITQKKAITLKKKSYKPRLPIKVVDTKNQYGTVRLNKKFQIRKPGSLSPPIVDKPIHECAVAVHVTGFAPEAVVQIWVNQVELVGSATPEYGFADINLTRSLILGESITATQTVTGIQSAHSLEAVTVTKWSPTLTKPNVTPDIWECGRVVSVGNLVPSARVKIFESTIFRGQAESPQTSKSIFTNAKLKANRPVTAQQYACEADPAKKIISPLSDQLNVKPFPASFLAPTIEEETLIIGNDSVTLNGLYRGALIKVYDKGVLIGSGWSTASRNWVPLTTALLSSSVITATQELCAVSPHSDKGIPTSKLAAPIIIAPLCDDDQYIRIDGTILNAIVIVMQQGQVIAFGGAAASGETRLALGTNLVVGQPVTTYQYMEDTVSPQSITADVCACSKATKRGISSLDQITHSPVSCPANSTTLFSVGSNNVMQFELQADWATINDPALNSVTTKHLSMSSGTLRYMDGGVLQTFNVTVNGRGHSRFDYCAFRPLKIDFGSTQSSNVFAGHKKVKLVTHCGNHVSDPWILGGTPAVQRNRLLSEYYFYEVLETMNTSALATRLAEITYKNPDGSILTTEYAFWREPEKKSCKRCGWQTEAKDAEIPGLAPNAKSVFQTDMIEKFVYNNDYFATSGHNTIVCKDVANNGFYIPFDWDLTGVIRPEYFKNGSINYKQNASTYGSWLGGTVPAVRTKVQGWRIVDNRNEMRSILANSLLEPAGRKHMLGWFDQYINVLRCYLSNKSK